MTYSIIVGKYKLIFSDTHFKDFRKKPTVSVYDADTNSETKIASFNSQETFEWFVEAVVEADRKTENSSEIPNNCTDCECTDDCTECRKAEHGCKDEPQTDCTTCEHWKERKDIDVKGCELLLTNQQTDCPWK